MLDIPRTLQFDAVREDRPPVDPVEAGGWEPWARGRETRPAWVTMYSGPPVESVPGRIRIGGVFVAPARQVLGLRLWNDADEGSVAVDADSQPVSEPVPFVLYDLEKIIRMMLHQSGLALEILASPWVLFEGGSGLDGRGIVEAAITADIVDHYLEVARGCLQRVESGRGGAADLRDGARQALTGLALTEGRVSTDFEALRTWAETRGLEFPAEDAGDTAWSTALAGAVERLAAAERDDLPDSPRHYDALNAYLVERRLNGCGDDDAGREAS